VIVDVTGEIFAVPYGGAATYGARLTSEVLNFRVERSGSTTLQITIHNRSAQAWDNHRFDYLRIGGLLRKVGHDSIIDLDGVIPPSDVGKAQACTSVVFPIQAPDEPGRYILFIDFVQEWVAWFGDRGGERLQLTMDVV
jgi:hypothetical protein